ncbi:MAG: sialidase family protein [Gammaproteobacteria bacterium]
MLRTSAKLTALLIAMCIAAPSGVRLLAAGAPLQWTWDNPTPSGDQFNVVAYGGGIYVAAGQDGVLFTSSDGIDWTSRSGGIGMGGNYTSTLYDGRQFLLAGVGADGTSHVTVSSDGIHWTDTPLNLANDGKIGLAYGNGTYLALSGSSDATSSDGMTWTGHSLGFEQAVDQSNLTLPDASVDDMVLYANHVFIAYGEPVGSAGANQGVYYSTDNGMSWTASGQAACGVPFVSNGSGFFSYALTIASSAVPVCTSTDGKNWTRQTANGLPPFGIWVPIVWNGSQFVTQYSQTYTSTDGVNWTGNGIDNNTPTMASAVVTGSGYLGAVYGILNLATSPDFADWTSQSLASGPASPLNDMIYAGGKYIAVGGSHLGTGASILESSDGLGWTSIYVGAAGSDLTTVAYGNGLYVAAGTDMNGNTLWLSSTDGLSWTAIATPPAGALASDLAFGNGVFVTFVGNCRETADGTCNAAVSTDGKTWVTHAMPTADQAPENLAFGSSGRFATLTDSNSNNSVTVYNSTDGATWTAGISFTTPQYTSFNRLRALGNGFGAVGIYMPPCTGQGMGCVDTPVYPAVALSPDGATWSTSELNPSFQSFSDIATDGTHYFIADGSGLALSTDGKEWCALGGFPIAASANTVIAAGSQLLSAGANGDLVSSPLSTGAGGSSVTCTGVTYSALDISTGGSGSGGVNGGGSSSGGSGSLDLATLLALLALSIFRRRTSLFC